MKTDVGAAYIPMPKGRGFTPHFDKNVSTARETASEEENTPA